MAGFNLLIKVTFSVLCLIQITFILANMIYTLKAGDNLALMSLIDLMFPILGLVALWRYDDSQKDPTDSTCIKSFLLFIVYTVWCLIWLVIGLFLVIVRSGAAPIQADSAVGRAFLGDTNGIKDPAITGLTATELVLQFIGFVFGIFLAKMSKSDSEKNPKSGFV